MSGHVADEVAIARVWGAEAEARLSGPVAAADFDADGTVDLAVGSPGSPWVEPLAGTVRVVKGADLAGDVWLADASAVLHGDSADDRVGVSLATIAGRADAGATLLVGVDHAGEHEWGQALVWRDPLVGPADVAASDVDGVVRGDTYSDAMGDTLVDAGDVDGDGTDDQAVGAPLRDGVAERTGRVWIVGGGLAGATGPNKMDVLATAHVDGDLADDRAGWRLVAPGDLDGDGRADLLVGSTRGVFWFPGVAKADALTLAGAPGSWTTTDAGAGTGLAAGDVDGDGVIEVWIGDPIAGDGGRVWRVDGPPEGALDLDTVATGTYDGDPGADAGASVAAGPAGVLVGSPGADRVDLLDGGLSSLSTLLGDEGTRLGESVAWIGDADGDGTAEAIAFAPDASRTLAGQGEAVVVSGAALQADDLPSAAQDLDGDGASAATDCDDGDPRRSPDLDERCRTGVDEDCDGSIDEEDCRRGCETADGRGVGLLALLPFLVRRRPVRRGRGAAAIALAVVASLTGCAPSSPHLLIDLPDPPLGGVVPVAVTGPVDRIVLAVDGRDVAGGAGPELDAEWDSTDDGDGRHLLVAHGYYGKDGEVIAWEEVEISASVADEGPPSVRFLEPHDGDVFTDDEVHVVLAVGDDTGIASVDVLDGETLLARLPADGPYDLLWTAVPAGPHRLHAEATDAAGHSTGTSVDIVVDPGT